MYLFSYLILYFCIMWCSGNLWILFNICLIVWLCWLFLIFVIRMTNISQSKKSQRGDVLLVDVLWYKKRLLFFLYGHFFKIFVRCVLNFSSFADCILPLRWVVLFCWWTCWLLSWPMRTRKFSRISVCQLYLSSLLSALFRSRSSSLLFTFLSFPLLIIFFTVFWSFF